MALTAPQATQDAKLPNEILFMIIKEVDDPATLRNLRRVSTAFADETTSARAFHTITKHYLPTAFHELNLFSWGPCARFVRKLVITDENPFDSEWARWGNFWPRTIERAWNTHSAAPLARANLAVAFENFASLEEVEVVINPGHISGDFETRYWQHWAKTLLAIHYTQATHLTVRIGSKFIHNVFERTVGWGPSLHPFLQNFEAINWIAEYGFDLPEQKVFHNNSWDSSGKVCMSTKSSGIALDFQPLRRGNIWTVVKYFRPILRYPNWLAELKLHQIGVWIPELSDHITISNSFLQRLDLDAVTGFGGTWTGLFQEMSSCFSISSVAFRSLIYGCLCERGCCCGTRLNPYVGKTRAVFSDVSGHATDPYALRDFLVALRDFADQGKRLFQFSTECEVFFQYPSLQDYEAGKRGPPEERLIMDRWPGFEAWGHNVEDEF